LAEAIPLATTDNSVEQRLRCRLKNGAIDVRRWYEPFGRAALQAYYPLSIFMRGGARSAWLTLKRPCPRDGANCKRLTARAAAVH